MEIMSHGPLRTTGETRSRAESEDSLSMDIERARKDVIGSGTAQVLKLC